MTLARAFAVTPSSLNDFSCHTATICLFINDTSACSSATRTFSWMSFPLADRFDVLELETEFHFEDLDPEDFELFPEDFDFLSNFTSFSVFKGKILITYFTEANVFRIIVIQLNHFLVDFLYKLEYIIQLL